MRGGRIHCLATGVQNGTRKLYFYAQDASHETWFLAEVTVTAAHRLSAVLKAQDASLAPVFSAHFKQLLQPHTTD